jgi:glc operon protein GlcG
MLSRLVQFITVLALLFSGSIAAAQFTMPYGPPVSVENAKKAAAAALAEARKHNWLMAVAVVDPDGTLVYYEKMDNALTGSAEVAIDKARTSAMFKRPSKAFEDLVASGGDNLRLLDLRGATPIAGGVPLMLQNKIVGAIGISGDSNDHDAICAQAGADELK